MNGTNYAMVKISRNRTRLVVGHHVDRFPLPAEKCRNKFSPFGIDVTAADKYNEFVRRDKNAKKSERRPLVRLFPCAVLLFYTYFTSSTVCTHTIYY